METFGIESPATERSMIAMRSVLAIGAVALLYGLLAYAGIMLTRSESRIAAVWLPNAVVVAILLGTDRRRIWPYLVAGFCSNLAVNLVVGDAVFSAIGLSLANSLEVSVAIFGMAAIGRRRPDMSDFGDLVRFSVVAGIVAPLCSALVAISVLAPTGWSAALRLSLNWLLTDGLGMVLVAPALWVLARAWQARRRPTRREVAEWIAVFSFGLALNIAVFAQVSYPFLFLTGGVIFLHAFRLGSLGTVVSVIEVSVIAVLATAFGRGPIHLVDGGLAEQLVTLQIFLVSSFVMGIPVAILLERRDAMMAELVTAKQRAEAAAVAKSNFLANMSHEIRTPMNGVLGFAELLMESPLGNQQRQQAQMIVESGHEMMRLLNDLLDLSKIEAGQLRFTSERVDLRHILDRCHKMMIAIAARKGLGLRIVLDPSLPSAILGDSLRLRQVLLNLIGNALKFTDVGEVVVRAWNEGRADGGDMLVIEVADSGMGIAPAQLETIFRPFEQSDDSLARRFGGTGLGLTISRELIERMGGTLSVTSELGVGSQFSIHLAVHSAAELAAPVAAPAVVVAPLAQTPCSVLLVEDLDVNQLLVTAMLERLGHRVTLAINGADAVEKVAVARAANRLFDLVLMDVQMPLVDGYQATRMIRSAGLLPSALPIVALTANAYPEDIAACLDAGMQAHVVKPITKAALASAVAGWARRSRPGALVVDRPLPAKSAADLEAMYAVRRAAVMNAVEDMLSEGRFLDDEVREVASQLHQLAGTAGLFGETDLGAIAGQLERQLLGWSEGERRQCAPIAFQQLLRTA